MTRFRLHRRPRRLVAVAGLGLLAALGACAKPASLDSTQGIGAALAQPGTSQDFTINVGDRVFFETDSATLTPSGQATLDRQAQWLGRYPQYALMLEGHADERGTREYNLALGARRATAAQSYLISRGVAAGRVQTISYGKERPVATCSAASCWSQNRRAVSVLRGAGS